MRKSLIAKNNIARIEKAKDQYIEKIRSQYGDNFSWDILRNDQQWISMNEAVHSAESDLRYWTKREPLAFCNYHAYTDVHPYEVIRVVSDTTVEVRIMKSVQTAFPKDFHPGGFCGHFADNRSGQDYEYESNPEAKIERVRWSERNKQWQQGKHSTFIMSDQPYKYHDYNF